MKKRPLFPNSRLCVRRMDRRVLPCVIGLFLLLPLGCGDGDPTGPTPVVTTTSLLDAGQNVEYSEPLTATGGDGEYEWSVLAGALPAGLSLDPYGEIRGTPTMIETQDFTVQVESGNQTAQQALSITVGVAQVLQPNEPCSDYPAYAVATFEDANLEIAVRASTGGHEDLSCRVISRIEQLGPSGLENDDIQSLVGIHNLTGLLELFLGWQAISDVSPLSSLTGLTHLELWRNSITDISSLSPLTGLTTLFLHENSITDISALSEFTSLENLWLYQNFDLSDISALSELTSLINLQLTFTSITDLTPLGELTSLTLLLLDHGSITDVSPLSGLTSLETLWLNANSITDVSPLSGLIDLTDLQLNQNSITDITALAGLTALTRLDVFINSITDIGPLSSLTGLTELFLSQNSITDVGSLSSLTSLMTLYLDGNAALADIQPLLDNTGLGAGDQVFLMNKNVSCTDVAALEAKGVTVGSGCP